MYCIEEIELYNSSTKENSAVKDRDKSHIRNVNESKINYVSVQAKDSKLNTKSTPFYSHKNDKIAHETDEESNQENETWLGTNKAGSDTTNSNSTSTPLKKASNAYYSRDSYLITNYYLDGDDINNCSSNSYLINNSSPNGDDINNCSLIEWKIGSYIGLSPSDL